MLVRCVYRIRWLVYKECRKGEAHVRTVNTYTYTCKKNVVGQNYIIDGAEKGGGETGQGRECKRGGGGS